MADPTNTNPLQTQNLQSPTEAAATEPLASNGSITAAWAKVTASRGFGKDTEPNSSEPNLGLHFLDQLSHLLVNHSGRISDVKMVQDQHTGKPTIQILFNQDDTTL